MPFFISLDGWRTYKIIPVYSGRKEYLSTCSKESSIVKERSITTLISSTSSSHHLFFHYLQKYICVISKGKGEIVKKAGTVFNYAVLSKFEKELN